MRKKITKAQDTVVDEVVQDEQVESLMSVVDNVDDVNVGMLLKKARVKKKKDIQKIAEALRIRVCYLQALEESDYEKFPGRTYAIGFLRNYADFLGLDVDVLIEQYRKETSDIKECIREMPIIEQPNLFPKAKYLFWSILVIVLMWSFWYFLTYSETPAVVVQPDVENNIVEEVETLPVVVEEVIEEKTETKEIVKPEKKEQKQPALKPKNAVQIVANEDVWIEIEQDDMLILSKTLKKGETYDVPSSEIEMFLKTGNAGGMDIFVDGQKVKSFGPRGAVRSGISLSAEKLKKH